MRLPREIPALVTDAEMLVPAELICNKNLSAEARGLLFTIYATHEPTEAIEPADLTRDGADSLEEVQRWLDELVFAGFIDP